MLCRTGGSGCGVHIDFIVVVVVVLLLFVTLMLSSLYSFYEELSFMYVGAMEEVQCPVCDLVGGMDLLEVLE